MPPLESEGQCSTLHMPLSQVIQAPMPAFLICNNEDETHAHHTGFVRIQQDGVCQVPGTQVLGVNWWLLAGVVY